MIDYFIKCFQFPQAVWIITYNTSKHYFIVYILRILYHMLPALFIDKTMEIFGKKAKMLKMYRKVTHFSGILNFFTLRSWNFQDKNMKRMLSTCVDNYIQ